MRRGIINDKISQTVLKREGLQMLKCWKRMYRASIQCKYKIWRLLSLQSEQIQCKKHENNKRSLQRLFLNSQKYQLLSWGQTYNMKHPHDRFLWDQGKAFMCVHFTSSLCSVHSGSAISGPCPYKIVMRVIPLWLR